jgi:glutathione S-transferase
MELYYCEVLNPRKACAVARYLNSPVEFVRVDLAKGQQRTPEFLALNPNGKVPVLRDGDFVLWESNAIMCELARRAKSDLWPNDERQIEVLRWLSFDARHFTHYSGALYFEYVIKPWAGIGEVDEAKVAEALKGFKTSAAVVDGHLQSRNFLLGEQLSVADFALSAAFPYAEVAKLPLAEFPAIQRWHARLRDLPAWREPFPTRERAAA